MTLQLQELNFTLFTKSFNPIIFNYNTLHQGGIILPDWKLAAEPIYSDMGVKLVFTNKVRIIAQPNRIFFAETIGEKELENVLLSSLVRRSLQTFPDIEYQAISLNPSGYVPFNSNLKAARYLSDGLLADASWQTFNEQKISAVGLKLAYPYKTGNFYIDINQANVEVSNTKISAVWFAGNFNYQLKENNSIEKNNNLISIISNWQFDVINFQDFVNQKMLNISFLPSASLFPL